MLRASPLILLFQHNNLRATEWTGIRRELAAALAKVDATNATSRPDEPPLSAAVKLHIVQTGIFEAALRIVDYFPSTSAAFEAAVAAGRPTNDLSTTAYAAVRAFKGRHSLSPLLAGPVAVLAFPAVSTEHLRAALSILSPTKVGTPFAPPTRRQAPSYYDIPVQEGLVKLVPLAARVEGEMFDMERTRAIGEIEGGMSGLRAQLVSMLQGAGAQLTGVLEGASKSLYLTMESRRSVLEEETGEKKE